MIELNLSLIHISQNSHMNRRAIKKPMAPHPGNVSAHVSPISFTKMCIRDSPCAVRGGRLRAESGGPGVSSPK